ncbi:TlpA disulfide reductase family protein [Fulvivirgaceae bacterium BMA10]|uniref:TlpA disulfide reductase family protein n=1 Tax=Splendidivirga corallicola TaxID=3051826 RepID=A0ABT8KL42_9BACT|nr:TlpA disulfide reductase family protein [Fulvivirgaceae bacterium BMA10]
MVKLSSLALVFTFSCLVLLSCQTSKDSTPNLTTGIWRGIIEVQGNELPFNFEVIQQVDSSYALNFINGEEKIYVDEVEIVDDSLFITMHIFDIEIRAKIKDRALTGIYKKNYLEDYVLPFKAQHGVSYRFEPSNQPASTDFGGKWSVTFVDEEGVKNESVGIFEERDGQLFGTFLTTTGDYRFLEGSVRGNEMALSTYDGNHAFLFKAKALSEDSLKGDFWSGKTWHETWTAVRNDNASLPDANSLTYLKDGYDKISFSFPGLDGNLVSLDDEKYKNKVVLLQIFGTWCPNCMDETRFYADWYRQNKERDIAIIGLAYEQKDDFEYAKGRIEKMIKKLNVEYDYVVAGISDKEEAAKTLPMLNHVLSYPTTIFLDKKGDVRRIHTGFTGPGTGVYYEQFVEDFNAFMELLLTEETDNHRSS